MSVIIACYRAGDYLREAVESVHAVRPQIPYEIIIVDDASPDPATQWVLNALDASDPKVRILDQFSNQGQSAARNKAIEHAKYDYIMPLDADDKLNSRYPGYLDKSFSYLEDYPELILTYSKCRFIGARNGPSISSNYEEDIFLLKNMIPAYGVFRRSEALEAGGYREDLRYAEDWEFWVHLHEKRFESGQERLVHRFREPHYLYRQHNTGENVSVRQYIPMEQFYSEMTLRNQEIYERHFHTLDPLKLCELSKEIYSPLKIHFDVARAATGREYLELAWNKVKKGLVKIGDHASESHPHFMA